jgi:hypothetical protein
MVDIGARLTAEDFREVRPGVLKVELDGREVFVIRAGVLEACEACGATGRIPSMSRSGRRSSRKCFPCKGTGRCDPQWNLRRGHGRHILTHDLNLERAIERLNANREIERQMSHFGPLIISLMR